MKNRFDADVVIKTIDQAREIFTVFLDRINHKYELLNSANLEKNANIKNQMVHFDRNQFQEKIAELNSEQEFKLKRIINRIEKKRLAQQRVDTLKPINPDGYHSNAFNVFFNQSPVITKHIDARKKNKLLQAYFEKDFLNTIFFDSNVIGFFISLLLNKKFQISIKKQIDQNKQDQLFESYFKKDFTNAIFRDPELLQLAVIFSDTEKCNMKKNINKIKQDQLLYAYRNQNFENVIFRDSELLNLAISLLDSGKLDGGEFETILIINNARSPLDKKYLPTDQSQFYPIKYYRILDDNNEFTNEAKSILIKSFNINEHKYMTEEFDDEKNQNFKFLMQAVIEKYPSENVFFTVSSREFHFDVMAIDLAKSLSSVLYHGAWPIDPFPNSASFTQKTWNEKLSEWHGDYPDELTKIYLPFFVDYALLLSCYPVRDVVFVQGRSGKLSPLDIEKGIEGEVALRPGHVAHFEEDKNHMVHGISYLSKASKYDHDRYHAQLQTRIGYTIRQTLERIRLLARTQILMHSSQFERISWNEILSSAIWMAIDSELTDYNSRDRARPGLYKAIVEYFCLALQGDVDHYENAKVDLFFKIENGKSTNKITDFGIVWFIDLVRMRDTFWYKINFDPDHLPAGMYQENYQIAKALHVHFKYDANYPNNPDHSKYNIYIFRLYTALLRNSFNPIMTAFKDKLSDILKNQEFRRNNKITFMGLMHTEKGNHQLGLHVFLPILALLPVAQDNWSADLNYQKHEDLFRAVIMIYSYLRQFDYIQKHVLPTLYELISEVLTTNTISNNKKIDDCFENFEKFLSDDSNKIDLENIPNVSSAESKIICEEFHAYCHYIPLDYDPKYNCVISF